MQMTMDQKIMEIFYGQLLFLGLNESDCEDDFRHLTYALVRSFDLTLVENIIGLDRFSRTREKDKNKVIRLLSFKRNNENSKEIDCLIAKIAT